VKADKEQSEAEHAAVTLQLKECRAKMSEMAKDVERAYAEMDKYAEIVEVLENKLQEAEERAVEAEARRQEAYTEMYNIRQRYINALD
jgi:chromosome segregation ATPase